MEAATKSLDREKLHTLEDAAALLKKSATAKFDETAEIHVRLGIDVKQSDQQVRGTINLTHGTGKSKRVAVVAKGEAPIDVGLGRAIADKLASATGQPWRVLSPAPLR